MFLEKNVTCAVAVTAMFAVFNPVVLISGTIFLGFDPHGVFQPAGFAGALVTAWLLFISVCCSFGSHRYSSAQQRSCHCDKYLPCQYFSHLASGAGLSVWTDRIKNFSRLDW